MANPNTPWGLKPVKSMTGPWDGSTIKVLIPATVAAASYIGDPVIYSGTADTGGQYAAVSGATGGDGNYVTGAIVAFEPDPTNLTLTYRAAATARYAYITTDPDLIYEVQEDGGTLAATDVGGNVSLVSGTGSTVTGLSGWELDSDTNSTEASAQCRIIGLADRADNALGADAKWLVTLNLNTQHYTTGL